MTELDKAYLAGIVDGEGTVSIKTEHSSRPFTIYLTVANTNYEMIKLFEGFGGKVRERNWEKNPKNVNKNWKLCYEWQLSKKKAAGIIEQLLPYLRIKKRQAQLTLRLAKLRKKYNAAILRWNPDLKNRLYKLYARIKAECKKLNKRGKL